MMNRRSLFGVLGAAILAPFAKLEPKPEPKLIGSVVTEVRDAEKILATVNVGGVLSGEKTEALIRRAIDSMHIRGVLPPVRRT